MYLHDKGLSQFQIVKQSCPRDSWVGPIKAKRQNFEYSAISKHSQNNAISPILDKFDYTLSPHTSMVKFSAYIKL